MQTTRDFARRQRSSAAIIPALGQSLWLNGTCRSLIQNGELHRLIQENGITGLTSNLAVLHRAIANTSDYDEALSARKIRNRGTIALYEQLAIQDTQAAADVLQPVYSSSDRKDGYVCLDIPPCIATDTEQTVAEVRRLRSAVDRPNLMIKVPAIPAGIPAIQQLVSEGTNVIATLLFSQAVYLQVAEAYFMGLEAFAKDGGDITQVASVASFPIRSLDIAANHLLIKRQEDFAGNEQKVILLQSLEEQIAIANARLTYQKYLEVYRSDRWYRLANKGARPQRLLWTDTYSQNSLYSDALYVEELIGPDTINAVGPVTLAALDRRRTFRRSLTEELDVATEVLACLPEVLINFSSLVAHLRQESICQLRRTFSQLLSAIEQKANPKRSSSKTSNVTRLDTSG